MNKEIQNVICPRCQKVLTAKTFKNWHCEYCNENLQTDLLKKGDKIYAKTWVETNLKEN